MAKRRRRGWRRWLGRILGGAVVIVVGLVVVLFFYFRASIPDYDGTVTIAGLGAPATVVRDRNAVPHIFAADILDAYRALGYVHAQDRFFQMELNRRLGAGRLAEVFGAAALPRDRLSRVLNLYALAEGQVAGMTAEPRSALEAYAEGVNAWLSDEATTLPPEIVVLRIEVEPWRPADSVVWGKLMALRLSGNQRDDVLRSRLASQLSAAQIADLWPGPNQA